MRSEMRWEENMCFFKGEEGGLMEWMGMYEIFGMDVVEKMGR